MYVEVCINIWQVYPPLTRRHIFVRLQRSFWHLSYIGSTLTYNCFQIKNKLIWLHILCSAFLFSLKCVCVFCSFFYLLYFISYQWTVKSQLYCLHSAYFPIYLPCLLAYCLRCAFPLFSLPASLPRRMF